MVIQILSQIETFFKNLQLNIFDNLNSKNFDEFKLNLITY
jgi:hypothetical protein